MTPAAKFDSGRAWEHLRQLVAIGPRPSGSSAIEQTRKRLEAQGADISSAGLRVGVRGGGCSGFQYALAFDEQRDDDTVIEDKGIRLLVDRASLPYVQGSVIDFVDGLQGAGFKVENPNVIAACGCGSSFRVAEEEEVSAV